MLNFKRSLWILGVLMLLAVAGCSGGTGQPLPDDGQHPQAAYKSTDVVKWNNEMVTAIRTYPAGPTDGARTFFMIQSAIYDAWSMYTPVSTPISLNPAKRRPADEQTEQNRRAAVNYAAYLAIKRAFPNFEDRTGRLSSLLRANGFVPNEGTDPITPAGIARLAVTATWDARENDGSNWQNQYADTTSAMFPELYQSVNTDTPGTDNCIGQPGHDLNRWTPMRCPTGTREDEGGYAIVDDNDPSSFTVQKFHTPHWGAVRPFALISGDEYRPPAPPKYGDHSVYVNSQGLVTTNHDEYMRQTLEVKELSGNLTDREKVIARYWAREFKGSMTPPGHLNMLAYGIAERDRHNLDQDVKFFLAINAALFDSSIAAWECKRHYDNQRPISAIQHMFANELFPAWNGPGRDGEMVLGKDWRPFMPEVNNTPPFPDYVSGHATFTAAWAQTLTSMTGSDRFYDGVTRTREYIDFTSETVVFEGEPRGDMLGEFVCSPGQSDIEPGLSPKAPVTLRWNSFFDCAEESGISRLYMGIHFEEASKRGQELGKKVAARTFAKCQQYWNGQIKR
ncbi:vanadium-dependent haloperoxidase [bacterium]|nr:vanadium-dependent haloperoxidase [bacterium]